MAIPSSAQPIDGFVSPAFVFSSVAKASRTRVDIQFGRLQKNVELDFSFGNGNGYRDYGVAFRVFNHFQFGSDDKATGVSVGLGIGAYSADKATPRPFVDLGVSPFVRGVYDFGIGVGIALEAGLQLVPLRSYTDKAEPKSNSTLQTGFFAGATLLLSSRWLE